MLRELIILANNLDQKGLKKEADFLDKIIKSAGELISLDEKRTPQDLWDITTRRIEGNEENMTELIFLDDRETFSGEGFIAKVTEEEAEQIQEGNLSLMDIPLQRVQPLPSFDEVLQIAKS
jgi:hypothetical protein